MNYLCIGLTAKENPFHLAPIVVNRFLGGINNIKLQPYKRQPNNLNDTSFVINSNIVIYNHHWF